MNSCASSRASTNFLETTDGTDRFRTATEPARDFTGGMIISIYSVIFLIVSGAFRAADVTSPRPMRCAARISDCPFVNRCAPSLQGDGFLFSGSHACTFIRADRRLRFCATNHDRCRWHRRGLCQPVRRDRSGARHGHARAHSPTRLRSADLRRIPMLFQHDPAEPIGIWLELREDYRGLLARGA